jgi:Pyridoxamine 5'-phosphate oxidase
MAVATVDNDGCPDARMMLLKGADERGFIFYTNMRSPKAQALLQNGRVSLCFYWREIDKQVRIRGRAGVVSSAEADPYFATPSPIKPNQRVSFETVAADARLFRAGGRDCENCFSLRYRHCSASAFLVRVSCCARSNRVLDPKAISPPPAYSSITVGRWLV